MPNVPYSYEVNGKLVHEKWFLNTNKFLNKMILIAKLDCASKRRYG